VVWVFSICLSILCIILESSCKIQFITATFLKKIRSFCADDGPGTLREGCNSKDPLWIVFKVSGTIPLIQGILVSSNKTIDGRGQHVKITGKSLQLFKCENVIICNLEFEGGTGPDVDGIQLKRGTSHVWIDRCTFSNYADGLIDITLQSSYVTVSR
jgi:pectate lyase